MLAYTLQDLLVLQDAHAITLTWIICHKHRGHAYIVRLVLTMIILAVTATDSVGLSAPLFLVSFSRSNGKVWNFSNWRIYGAAMGKKLGTDRLTTLQKRTKDLSSVKFVECCNLRVASVTFVCMPSMLGWITPPKLSTRTLKKKLSLCLKDTLNLSSSFTAVLMWSRCSSTDLGKMMTSSRYTRANCHLTFCSMMSIPVWKLLGVFYRPKGVLKNLHSPWCDVNMVFLALVVHFNWQYPEFELTLLNWRWSQISIDPITGV